MANNNTRTAFEIAINKAIGKKIRYARENYYIQIKEIVDGEFRGTYKPVKRLVPQTRLAKAVGVTFQQIQKYEQGKNGCSIPKLLLIGKFLKKPLNYFISETTELLGQDISPSSNPIAPSIKENGINQKSKCH